MKSARLSLFAAVLAAAWLSACAPAPQRSDALFQLSTFNAILEGVYDGQLSCGELKRHGDFGIGTFDGLNGEMVLLDGEVFRVPADGKAQRVADGELTPFASVTRFAADQTLQAPATADFAALTKWLDTQTPTKNVFYAVRIEADFPYVKTRSVPRQSKPYPPLTEVTKTQPTFELRDIRGTLVGFRCPEYVGGVNVPGWHLHFISADRRAGGHLLDCRFDKATVALDIKRDFVMRLPEGGLFSTAALGATRREDVEATEK